MLIKTSLIVFFFCALAQQTFIKAQGQNPPPQHSVLGNIMRTGAEIQNFRGYVGDNTLHMLRLFDSSVDAPRTVIGDFKRETARVLNRLADKTDNTIKNSKKMIKGIYGNFLNGFNTVSNQAPESYGTPEHYGTPGPYETPRTPYPSYSSRSTRNFTPRDPSRTPYYPYRTDLNSYPEPSAEIQNFPDSFSRNPSGPTALNQPLPTSRPSTGRMIWVDGDNKQRELSSEEIIAVGRSLERLIANSQ